VALVIGLALPYKDLIASIEEEPNAGPEWSWIGRRSRPARPQWKRGYPITFRNLVNVRESLGKEVVDTQD
jgi:hypothetical protein